MRPVLRVDTACTDQKFVACLLTLWATAVYGPSASLDVISLCLRGQPWGAPAWLPSPCCGARVRGDLLCRKVFIFPLHSIFCAKPSSSMISTSFRRSPPWFFLWSQRGCCSFHSAEILASADTRRAAVPTCSLISFTNWVASPSSRNSRARTSASTSTNRTLVPPQDSTDRMLP